MHIKDTSNYKLNGVLSYRVRNTVTGEEYTVRDNNIIKVAAKEIMALSMAPDRLWDPNQQSWVTNTSKSDLAVRYMWFGTAEDSELATGYNYDGSLKNPIQISTAFTPLKRIEAIYFNNSYQPAGNPYNYDDVRPVLNEIVFETTMTADEYNQLPDTAGSDVMLAEVGLIAGPEEVSDDNCGCAPEIIFLGSENDGSSINISLSGTELVSIDPASTKNSTIKAGDTVKIVSANTIKTDTHDVLEQHNPYYMVVEKFENGRDLTLDRVPRDSDNNALTGSAGIFKVGHKMICYKKIPVFRKSDPLEITFSWSFLFG